MKKLQLTLLGKAWVAQQHRASTCPFRAGFCWSAFFRRVPPVGWSVLSLFLACASGGLVDAKSLATMDEICVFT